MASGSRLGQVHRGWVRLARPGWGSAAVEMALLAVVLLVFTRLHAAAGTDVAAATSNANALQSIEQGMHLNVELAMNRWLTEHEVLIPSAVLFYRLYYVPLIGVLVWIFLRHAEIYFHVRRTFVAMTGLALLVFWVLPMSPPRFALAGVVDIIAERDILAGQPSRDMNSGTNHLSAMPSLHVGWSAWCAYAAWSAMRGSHPRAAMLAWLFPLIMIADVLTTGNHYVLDVAGSAMVLLTAIAVATGWNHLIDLRTVSHRSTV